MNGLRPVFRVRNIQLPLGIESKGKACENERRRRRNCPAIHEFAWLAERISIDRSESRARDATARAARAGRGRGATSSAGAEMSAGSSQYEDDEEDGLIAKDRRRAVPRAATLPALRAVWWLRLLACAVVVLAVANLLLAATVFSSEDRARLGRGSSGGSDLVAVSAIPHVQAAAVERRLPSGAAAAAVELAGSGAATATAVRVLAFGPAEDMRVVEGVTLPALTASQIRITLSYAGVNPVDTYIRAGSYAALPTLPFTPGEEGAGVVAAVGAAVDSQQFRAGDHVYVTRCITGSYATACNAEVADVHRLPSDLPLTVGCGLGTPYPAAYRALVSSTTMSAPLLLAHRPIDRARSFFADFTTCLLAAVVVHTQFQRAHARAGQSVLISGASGAVGLAAVQLAKAAGMHPVIGTAGSTEGLALVLEQGGADFALDHHAPGFLEHAATLAGGGLDVIVESSAHFNLGDDIAALSAGGTVAVVGSRGEVTIDPRDLMNTESSAVGVMLSAATARDLNEIHAGIGAGLADGSLRPYVGVVLEGLESAAVAHDEVISHASTGGSARDKICLGIYP